MLEMIVAQPADLLITDVMLPGLDGWALLAQVRARIPDLPAIVISAVERRDAPQRDVLITDHTAFLRKPFGLETLLAIVQRLTGSSLGPSWNRERYGTCGCRSDDVGARHPGVRRVGSIGMVDAQGKAKDAHDAHPADGHAQVLLSRELTSALTVMKGRIQLLRRRLRQGGDTARLEADLNAIEAELARLTKTVERISRGDNGG